ncbi:hypothetical protein KW795_03140 [Candidatus Microgenomates bacterium]|nr:hypothetical protein [Candidatus Microgenomates bacterium]
MVDQLEDKIFSRIRPIFFPEPKINLNSGEGIKNYISWNEYLSGLSSEDKQNLDNLVAYFNQGGKSESILYAVGSTVKKHLGMPLDHEPEDIDIKVSVDQEGSIKNCLESIHTKVNSLVETGKFKRVFPHSERAIDRGLRKTLILIPQNGKNIQIILPNENSEDEVSAQIDLSSTSKNKPIAYFGRL